MQGKYQKWAKENSFESMLPGDVKAHKKKAEQAQQTLNSHLIKCKLTEHIASYSDNLFKLSGLWQLIKYIYIS